MIKKKCRLSGEEFEITIEDLNFYKKMEVISTEDYEKLKSREISNCIGLPTLSPAERERRRWNFRGNKFWMKRCDGCFKNKMAWFSPENKDIKTFCEECFRSEKFDAREFGQKFDFSRDFFEQFFEMYYQVPKHISNAIKNENCEYIISAHQNKNCYMADEIDESRDCYFGYTFQRAESFVDGLYINDSEIGYECIKAEKCYSVFFSKNIFHCSESAFLQNCRSCKNCLFSTNLRNKEFYVFNKKVSKEEYKKYWDFIFSGSRENLEICRKKFADFLEKQFFPSNTMIQNEDCVGNYITFSKNARDCFYVDNIRDCRFCTDIHNSKDCYDVNIYEGEMCYECNHVGPKAYMNRFSQLTWFSTETDYSIDVYNCKNCFGCTGLKNQQYCIFNKKYPKEEYFKIKEKIIEHMKKTGEWGEFFPAKFSPQPYNHTFAQQFFPLKKEEAISQDLKWIDDKETIKEEGIKDFPDNISDITEDIFSKVFICSVSGKKFRFIKQEIRFYKKWGIPLPTISPISRIKVLWEKIGPRKLFDRQCNDCQKIIQTTFSKEKEAKILCKECYSESVI